MSHRFVALVGLLGLALCGGSSAFAANVPPEEANIAGLKAKFIDVGGIRTRYYDLGKGEPMVLVHGTGFSGVASANTWSLNIPGLSARFHVYAPDKLASGMTDNPRSDDDLNIRGEVKHLYAFVKALGLGPFNLVGQSRGGGAAFLFAIEHPELVKTLVIVDSATAAPVAGDDRERRRKRLFAACPREENDEGDQFRCEQAALYYDPRPVTDEFVASAAFMWRQPKAKETARRMTRAVRERGELISSEMVFSAYHRILTEDALKMPVLLYWAKNDPSVLPEQAYALYDIIAESNPRTWLLFTNRAGHFHFREHPEEFNRNVINFVTAWGVQ